MNAKYLTIICLIVIHCQTAKSNDPPEEDRKGKKIAVSTSTQDDKQNEIKEMLEKVEQKREEIWNIIEVKEDGDPKGYTTPDHVLRMLPDQLDKIILWLHENPGSDEAEKIIIKKHRFMALLQSLEPSPEKNKKRKTDKKL
ncbi:uncharacterized protein LOC126843526 [Adelges cooleyi]|uniref:uncharacterized protein LOC126843526 n=1 Tax=Adelges cooleyi TaxID=133065 RepID=UPI00217F4252|nr:uncharacterized protein LOC126843526 [Adelges cooleyi]